MADQRPFRFIDLPKDLRLMVYERLPSKTTYQRYTNLQSHGVEPDDVKVVWTSLPGVTILATCRLIESEARSIIDSGLAKIKSEPCRIIVTPEGLMSARLASILKRLARADVNSMDATNPRDIIYVAIYQPATTTPQLTASARVTKALNAFYLFWYEAKDDIATGYKEGLHVHVRPALLSDEEEALFDMARPLARDMPVDRSTPAKKVTDGINIEQEEWDTDWVEGERFF